MTTSGRFHSTCKRKVRKTRAQVAGQLHPQKLTCSDLSIRFTSSHHHIISEFVASLKSSPNSISGSQFRSTPPFSLDRRHNVVVTSLRTRILDVSEQKGCKFSILTRPCNSPFYIDVLCTSGAFRDVFVRAGTSSDTGAEDRLTRWGDEISSICV